MLRWLVVLGVGAGGTYAVQRYTLSYAARAATRLVLTDFARFEGCLLGAPPPPESGVADHAMAMARGTGDPVWPHSCAPHIGRLAREAEQVAADQPRERPLAAAARSMENALGEAGMWTERVQRGARDAPQWVGAYVALRREVRAFAERHGASVPPAEAPRHPRLPRTAADPPPVIPLAALPGGEEADIVDATATAAEFSVLLRDRRSRYSVCTLALAGGGAFGADGPRVACHTLRLPSTADPREAGFVPSERGAHLAVWGRAPASLRSLVDTSNARIVFIVGGRPDPTRDFWVGARRAMGVQINGSGASVLVADAGPVREVHIPGGYDVLTDERALIGTSGGAAAIWLDARSRRRAVLRALPLGQSADSLGGVMELASWREPRLTGLGRRIVPCAVPDGAAYVLAGDEHGGSLFSTADGAHFVRGAEWSRGLSRETSLACDGQGVSVLRAGPGALEAGTCDATSCALGPLIAFERDVSAARSGGALLVADGGGENGAARIRSVDPRAGRESLARIEGPVPAARAVRLVARGAVLVLFVAAAQTHALVSTDAGATFTGAALAP